jgi:hypothetical protein
MGRSFENSFTQSDSAVNFRSNKSILLSVGSAILGLVTSNTRVFMRGFDPTVTGEGFEAAIASWSHAALNASLAVFGFVFITLFRNSLSFNAVRNPSRK